MILKKIFSRFSFVGLTIIALFVLWFAVIAGAFAVAYIFVVLAFPEVSVYLQAALSALSWLVVVITVLHIINRDMVPETKLPWVLCVTALNVFGVAIYITFSAHRPSRRARRLYRDLHASAIPYAGRVYSREELRERMGRWSEVSEALTAVEPAAVVHGGTEAHYLASGEEFFRSLLDDVRKAKRFIFIETFILAKGKIWTELLAALEERVQAGVEVRLMYDDVGSMGRVHFRYHKTLAKKGIDCVKFNPFVPVVSNIHNNRDHRKIAVIDGEIGYTGGVNLGDEYANLTSPYGHWKDSAVRLEGAGVRNLTLLFLSLYDMQKRKAEDFSPYCPQVVREGKGYVQPYGDGPSPLYGKHLGEDVYLNIIGAAQRTLYITTPYLIIDYRMREALALAARRGVDVRLVTPHIPDKKLAFSLTRSNYKSLIEAGVKVYEYTPGFIHAKSFLADGEAAVVGTINLDYRSFLFHFEDAVFMYGTDAVEELGRDFEEIFSSSVLQTLEDVKRNIFWRGMCELAKLFAPLF